MIFDQELKNYSKINKPRLLFFITRTPWPAIDGTRERLLGELKALAPFFQIDLFITSDEKLEPAAKQALAEILNGQIFYFYQKKPQRYLRVLTHLFSRRPLQVVYFYSKNVFRELKKIAPDYQLFYCHTLRATKYFNELKFFLPDIGNRTILDFNDAISLNYQAAGAEARGFWKLIYLWEKKRIKNYELKLLHDFENFSIITAPDRDWLYSNWLKKYGSPCPKQITILRYGVNDDFLNYLYTPTASNLVFIGNLAYPPNRQGLELFCRVIWPLVIKNKPDSKLLIIGRGDKKTFSNYPNVELLGFLPNPYELMAKQAAFLNPITFGAGISTKTILAMALGLPVISTAIGVAGIEKISDQKNVVLIDYHKPLLAAETILALLNNQAQRLELSHNEKELVRSSYSQSKNNEDLISLARQVATKTEK